jgi:hypothetical protein
MNSSPQSQFRQSPRPPSSAAAMPLPMSYLLFMLTRLNKRRNTVKGNDDLQCL